MLVHFYLCNAATFLYHAKKKTETCTSFSHTLNLSLNNWLVVLDSTKALILFVFSSYSFPIKPNADHQNNEQLILMLVFFLVRQQTM